MASLDKEARQDKPKMFYGWWVLVSLFVVGATGPIARYALTAFFPALSADFGWSRSEIGLAQSFNLWVYSAQVILTGWMIDRFGARKTILVGGLCCLAGWLLLSTVSSLWQLYLFYGFIMAAAVSNTHLVPLQATSRKWFTKKSGLAAGVLSSALAIGTAVFVPMLTYLSSVWSWQTVAVASAFVLGVPALLLAIFVIRDTPESMGLLPDGIVPAGSSIQKAAAALPLKDVIKTPRVWLLFVAYGALGFVFNGISSHMVIWGTDLGMAIASAGFLGTLFGAPSIITRVGGGWLGDRVGKIRVMAAGTAFSLAMMLLGWKLIHTPAALFLFAPMMGMGLGAATALFAPHVGDTFGAKNVGSFFGVVTLGWGVIGGFGPIVWGGLRDRTGSYDAALLVSAGCFAVALLALLLSRPSRANAPV